MTESVRVRIAPSPTGNLHVGTARTALFNWLFARRHGGTFVLRIEDTDRERSKAEYTDQILASLEWLGLDWDEGPFYQSQRGELYKSELERMLKEGAAFRCFVPAEEVRAAVEEAKQRDGQAAYFSPDRDLAPDEAAHRAEAGESHVIRFRCPQGETVFEDVVRGEIRIDHGKVGDIVLARPDGAPTYNFVVVVDDADMGISHVIRGEDHISNTPKQLLIFQALGRAAPVYAHLPLIHGPDKRKLSKRHGAVTADAYRDEGHLPETLINYMALLGWSPGDDREVMTVEEISEAFSLERVGKSAAVFDPDKLLWLNGMKLRGLSNEAFVRWAKAAYERAPTSVGPGPEVGEEAFEQVALLVKERTGTWSDLIDQLEPFWADKPTCDPKAEQKHLAKPTARPVLEAVASLLEKEGNFSDPGDLEARLRELAEQREVKFGLLVHPCRVSLTGRDRGPGLTDVMVALGRDRTVARLRGGARRAADLGGSPGGRE